MKLELKHIAPYLPYDLECECPLLTEDREGSKVCDIVGAFSDWVAISRQDSSVHDEFEFDEFKPLLRPLSEINGSIKHNGQTIHVLGEMTGFEIETYRKWKDSEIYRDDIKIHISADLFLKLLGWHFDVFGLIEKGLAIKKL